MVYAMPAAPQNVPSGTQPPPAPSSKAPSTPQTPKSAATPSAIESQYVQFKPNFPLMPKSLNLFGYEREKVARGYPILSPDRTKMVITEVFFQPATYQTISRVSLIPVGQQPKLNDVLPPETVQQIETEKQMNQATDPTYTPQVDLAEVNPEPIWSRYQPEKQAIHREIIFQTGFEDSKHWYTARACTTGAPGERFPLYLIYTPGSW